MAFEQLTSFTKDVSDLADKPALGSAAALKAQFDAAPNEVREYLNKLINALKSSASGDSGAKNIGVTAINGVTGTDIQTLLEYIFSNWWNKSNLAEDAVHRGRREIDVISDINGVVANGTYRVYGDGPNHSSFPAGASGYGTLVVFSYGNSVTQVYFAHNTAKFYYRTKWNDSDWHQWKGDEINVNFIKAIGTFVLNVDGQDFTFDNGSGANILTSGLIRLAFQTNTSTFRVESNTGGAANLTVATVNGSSDRELKKNIVDYDKSALAEIESTPIRSYNFKEEVDGVDLPHVGIIMQEAPMEVVNMQGDGVDLYAMIAMSWKAIQELSAKNKELEKRISFLEGKEG